MNDVKALTLEVVTQAVAGTGAALRCVTEYQPAGGPGDKVFPPTYEGGKYATERRVDPNTGEIIDCVLLDSVQSQANRMELALFDAMEDPDGPQLPLLRVAFTDVPKPITVTSLEAPHRVADAIFRDSLIAEGGQAVPFRASNKGQALDRADIRNATGLYGLCPTALVFGLWDSTGPRGGLGAKFQRALVSEMVGYGAVLGSKTGSRLDPLGIQIDGGPVFLAKEGKGISGYTVFARDAETDKKGEPVLYSGKKSDSGKPGQPSKVNHGNIPPTWADGGYTFARALQTTVISLPTLRRLRFPLTDKTPAEQGAANLAARVVLVAIGLAAATLAREQGADLRSRCQLFPTGPFVWELLDQPGVEPTGFSLTGTEARALLKSAITAATQTGLPWEGIIDLTPSADLVELVRRSQRLAAQTTGED
jgi:CRISPR-associated protein Csb1